MSSGADGIGKLKAKFENQTPSSSSSREGGTNSKVSPPLTSKRAKFETRKDKSNSPSPVVSKKLTKQLDSVLSHKMSPGTAPKSSSSSPQVLKSAHSPAHSPAQRKTAKEEDRSISHGHGQGQSPSHDQNSASSALLATILKAGSAGGGSPQANKKPHPPPPGKPLPPAKPSPRQQRQQQHYAQDRKAVKSMDVTKASICVDHKRLSDSFDSSMSSDRECSLGECLLGNRPVPMPLSDDSGSESCALSTASSCGTSLLPRDGDTRNKRSKQTRSQDDLDMEKIKSEESVSVTLNALVSPRKPLPPPKTRPHSHLSSQQDAEKAHSTSDLTVMPKPPVGGAKPGVKGVKPSIGGAKPAVGRAKPAVGGAKPAVGGAKPAVGGAKPAVGGAKPAVLGAKPAVSKTKPALPVGAKPVINSTKPKLPIKPVKPALPALPKPTGDKATTSPKPRPTPPAKPKESWMAIQGSLSSSEEVEESVLPHASRDELDETLTSVTPVEQTDLEDTIVEGEGSSEWVMVETTPTTIATPTSTTHNNHNSWMGVAKKPLLPTHKPLSEQLPLSKGAECAKTISKPLPSPPSRKTKDSEPPKDINPPKDSGPPKDCEPPKDIGPPKDSEPSSESDSPKAASKVSLLTDRFSQPVSPASSAGKVDECEPPRSPGVTGGERGAKFVAPSDSPAIRISPSSFIKIIPG